MHAFARLFRIILLIVLLVSSAADWQDARSQQTVEIIDTDVNYVFGGVATFWVQIRSDVPPSQVMIFIKSPNEADTIKGETTLVGDRYIYIHDLVSTPLEAFTTLQYWFEIEIPGQEPFVTEEYYFTYEDNRFSWRTVGEEPFRVHWYDGDLAVGQMVLDVAQSGLKNAQRLLRVPTPGLVDIFVYASGVDMQPTLSLSGARMVAGHANPEQGLIITSLPPGAMQKDEAERQIPHELMHILIFQKFSQDYPDLPTWLVEGLASLNEAYQNPDYQTVLEDAAKKESFIPMTSICQSFPMEASQFFLAYAQSDSFVRYLYRKYGSEGLEKLLQAYANGLDCERGAESALGSTLTQLEMKWRKQNFNQNALVSSLSMVLLWIAIFLLVLIAPILLIVISLLRPKHGAQKRTAKPGAPGG
jgi:hypothetical protein